MLHVGWDRHLRLVVGSDPVELLALEFVSVGGWLSSGDLASGSDAQFLAVAEHLLILARAWSVCHHLRRAGRQSVWLLLVKIRFMVVMRGFVLLACMALLLALRAEVRVFFSSWGVR